MCQLNRYKALWWWKVLPAWKRHISNRYLREWHPQHETECKHYFCSLVVKKVGLQSSGCSVCSERVMLALITQQLHGLTLSWIDVAWTRTLSILYGTWEGWGSGICVWSFLSLCHRCWCEPRVGRTRSCCCLNALLSSPDVKQWSGLMACNGHDLHPKIHFPASCS